MKVADILEYVCLIVFTIGFFYIGIGSLYNHQFTHDFPQGYHHSDSFSHLLITYNIIDNGSVKYFPPYLANGFTDVENLYPFRPQIIGALFSLNSRLNPYDTLMFAIYLFAYLGAIIMYLIIRYYNKGIALLSLPVTLMFFNGFRNQWGFGQGDWGAMTASLMAIAVLWFIPYLKSRHIFIVIGIALAGLFFDHSSNIIILLYFGVLYSIYIFLFERDYIDKYLIKSLIFLFVIVVLLSGYYLLSFNSWSKSGSTFEIKQLFGYFTLYDGAPDYSTQIIDFGWMKLPIIIGFFLLIFYIKKYPKMVILGYSLLLANYSNLLGNSRSGEIKYFAPVFLCIFFGITLYSLLKFVKWKHIFVNVSLVLLLITPSTIKPYFNGDISISNKYNWEANEWIWNNTPKDAIIYNFYDQQYYMYYNTGFFGTKRITYIPEFNNLTYDVSNGILRRNMMSVSWSIATDYYLPKKEGLFRYEKRNRDVFFNWDICDSDYYIIKIQPFNERLLPLIQYNRAIREILLRHSFIKEVYSNEVISILKNENKGTDCIN